MSVSLMQKIQNLASQLIFKVVGSIKVQFNQYKDRSLYYNFLIQYYW